MLGGSLLTDKAAPGDFDAALFPSHTVDNTLNRLYQSRFDLTGIGQLRRFGGHFFSGEKHVQLMRQHRDGSPKGFVDLALEGVPSSETRFHTAWFEDNAHAHARMIAAIGNAQDAKPFYDAWMRISEQRWGNPNFHNKAAIDGYTQLRTRYDEYAQFLQSSSRMQELSEAEHRMRALDGLVTARPLF